jgi:hypothetical protein
MCIAGASASVIATMRHFLVSELGRSFMRIRFIIAPVALAGLLLAGCSSNTPPATQTATSAAPTDNGVAALPAPDIMAKATAAMTVAPVTHFKGSWNAEGDLVTADVTIAGLNGKGRFEWGPAYVLEVIRAGGGCYIKLPDVMIDETLKGTPAPKLAQVKALLKGKFVKPKCDDERFHDFLGHLSPSVVLKVSGTLSKGEAKTTNGIPTITLIDNGEAGGKVYVATTGQPLPIRQEPTGGGAGLDYDYPASVDITAPASAEVVDITALQLS